ncbi:MAG TPA: hypothetical protein DEB06_00530, partial [Phycisphaerales bacterium]|nr:hypothetical protein [Phycisphaerales bacterium]
MRDARFGSMQPTSERPRKVRGGVRLGAKEWPGRLHWAAQAWLEALARCAEPRAIEEGLDYARKGQTRSLEFQPGRIVASVQGRAFRAYRVTIQVKTFGEEHWRRAVGAMADNALHGAKLLTGELAPELGEVFSAMGLSLTARGTEDLSCACSAPGEQGWCKHAACAAILAAEALDRRPTLMFDLRGMPAEAVVERIRDLRAAAAGGSGALGGPNAGAAGADPVASEPLEAHLDDFWDAGPGLDALETPIRRPEVGHALLRRLGPSPFEGARFPLVGLLATCYDTISRAAVE